MYCLRWFDIFNFAKKFCKYCTHYRDIFNCDKLNKQICCFFSGGSLDFAFEVNLFLFQLLLDSKQIINLQLKIA